MLPTLPPSLPSRRGIGFHAAHFHIHYASSVVIFPDITTPICADGFTFRKNIQRRPGLLVTGWGTVKRREEPPAPPPSMQEGIADNVFLSE